MKQRFDNTQFIKLNTFHQTNFKSFQMHKKNQNLRKKKYVLQKHVNRSVGYTDWMYLALGCDKDRVHRQ